MAFTKITHAGIGSTGTVLLQNLDVIGIATAGFGVSTVDVFTTGITTFANETDSTSSTTGSVIVSGGVGIAGSLNVGGSVSVGGTLTYEDVTNVDSIGIITARSEIRVGSGITLSKDGDAFHTGVVTATTFVGNLTGDPTGSGANLTSLPAAQLTGTLPAISGANLTGIVAIPSGGIILWSGAADAIPSGFVLCDGNNSTPNLSGKFVVGYSASDSDFDVGDTGGAKTDSVSISVSGTTGSNGSFSNGSGSSGARIYQRNDGGVHTHSFSGSGSATVDTLPPYYALCYIMKT